MINREAASEWMQLPFFRVQIKDMGITIRAKQPSSTQTQSILEGVQHFPGIPILQRGLIRVLPYQKPVGS
jgi:hypothetical protein